MAHSSNAFRAGLAAALVLTGAAAASVAIVSADDKRPVAGAEPPRVTLSHPGSQPRIDVLVDGKPFTSYIWPGTLKKPTLYPIVSGNGVVLTRGFPPAAGERADHPHHVGLWFNYGDVNGYDFWNHSERDRRSGAAREDGPHHPQRRHPDGQRPRPRRARGADALGHRPERHAAGRRRDDVHLPRHRRRRQRIIDRATLSPGRRPGRHLRRQQGRHARPARPPRPRGSGREGRRVHRRRRQGHQDCVARLHGRDRRLYQQRGQDRRQGLGHARQVDDARRDGRRATRHHRHPRPSGQPGLSRPTGTRAATGCSPPTRSARRCSARARRS